MEILIDVIAFLFVLLVGFCVMPTEPKGVDRKALDRDIERRMIAGCFRRNA